MNAKERSIQRFGEKLHTLRTQRNLTLKELAGQFGLTAHGYISELERGKKLPTVGLVLNIARFFGVTTDELLKDELELREEHGEQAGDVQRTEHGSKE